MSSAGLNQAGLNQSGLHPAVAALAAADFTVLAAAFRVAGFAVSLPIPGALQILRPPVLGAAAEVGAGAEAGPTKRILLPSGLSDDPKPNSRSAAAHAVEIDLTPSVLLSVGVHGDETGPIEVLAHLLDALSKTPHALAVNLLLVVGNVDAIAAGKRFIDADLNRMFKRNRGDLAGTQEAARADQMMQVTEAFFASKGPVRWHLDLHTAIRPSQFPTFAIVPELIEALARQRLIDWLGCGGVEAVIMNPKSAGTYSYFTSEQCAAAGSTVELGRVGILGQNDLTQFAAASSALDSLLRGDASLLPVGQPAEVFLMAQEIMKLSDGFTMAFGSETQNFTRLMQGELIAQDGDTRYVVQHAEEYVVFPNPKVRVGQRAGLMVVRQSAPGEDSLEGRNPKGG